MSNTTDKKPWWSWWSLSDAGSHIGIKITLGIAAGVVATALALVR